MAPDMSSAVTCATWGAMAVDSSPVPAPKSSTWSLVCKGNCASRRSGTAASCSDVGRWSQSRAAVSKWVVAGVVMVLGLKKG